RSRHTSFDCDWSSDVCSSDLVVRVQTEGWGWGPVLHPDDLQRCAEVWGEAVRTGRPYEIEYRFKRAADGEYRWHLGRATAVRDEIGRASCRESGGSAVGAR